MAAFRTLILCLVVLAMATVNAAADAASAHQRGQSAIERAFSAAKSDHWREAHRLAAEAHEPLAEKLITWLRYQERDTGLAFAPIAQFIEANPDWPRLSRLRRAAEAAIGPGDEAARLADWFARYPPLSGAGGLAHLDALIALGQLAEVRAHVSEYWRDLDFSRDEAKEFQRKYGKQLANADHFARLDRLIWDEQYHPAQQMLNQVTGEQAALSRARLALLRREAGVDNRVAAVPSNLRDEPSLRYERLRWRRRAGLDEAARELLSDLPAPLAYRERWAAERLILARRALLDGYYSEARRIVADHGLSEGSHFAEAEFLAGWISLTYLKEPDTAYGHFVRLYNGVGYPISRARGAYWAGRAAAAANDKSNAEHWWRIAAAFPATFYGQQAAALLGQSTIKIVFTEPPATSTPSRAFAPELMAAVRLLHRTDQDELVPTFLRHLSNLATNSDDRFAIIALANEVAHPQEAVRAAKELAQAENLVPTPGYPTLTLRESTVKQQRETALILAVIRQESAFDPRAKSGAGARGMMQLLPATARRVAHSIGQRYSGARLLDDPQYNIRLGTAYLDSMMQRFDDAPALALAAYNAGPNRVEQWLRQFGDPRTGEIALIDWIESIPFDETRNYVQRVLESEIVYRALISDDQVAEAPDPSGRRSVEVSQP